MVKVLDWDLEDPGPFSHEAPWVVLGQLQSLNLTYLTGLLWR